MNLENISSDLRPAAEKIIAALKEGLRTGVPGSQLAKNKVQKNALAELKKLQLVANIGSSGRSAYVLLDDGDIATVCRQIVVEAILKKAATTKPQLFSKSQFEKLSLPKECKAQINPALKRLVEEKELIPFKVGRTNYFLPVKSLAEYLSPVQSATPPEIASVATFDPEQVIDAYRRIVQRTRYPDVLISDLQKDSGADLAALKSWLIEQCLQHRAIPGKGEWTVASDAAKAAAIQINNEPHLFVKFR